MIVVTVPVRIESSLNLREHWRKRANRNTSHRAAAFFALRESNIPPNERSKLLPCVITLTRIAPRELDDDNLQGGFKSVRDGVADWFGLDDRNKSLTWLYAQQRGPAKHYAAEVRIVSLPKWSPE